MRVLGVGCGLVLAGACVSGSALRVTCDHIARASPGGRCLAPGARGGTWAVVEAAAKDDDARAWDGLVGWVAADGVVITDPLGEVHGRVQLTEVDVVLGGPSELAVSDASDPDPDRVERPRALVVLATDGRRVRRLPLTALPVPRRLEDVQHDGVLDLVDDVSWSPQAPGATDPVPGLATVALGRGNGTFSSDANDPEVRAYYRGACAAPGAPGATGASKAAEVGATLRAWACALIHGAPPEAIIAAFDAICSDDDRPPDADGLAYVLCSLDVPSWARLPPPVTLDGED